MNMVKISGILVSVERQEHWAIGRLRFTPRGETIQIFSQDPKTLLAIPKISPVMIRGLLSISPDGEFQVTVKEIHIEPVRSERRFNVEGFNRMVIPTASLLTSHK